MGVEIRFEKVNISYLYFFFILSWSGLLYGQRIPLESDPDYYTFYPGSVLSLGRGVAANDLTVPKLPCLNFTKAPFEEGALTTEFETYLVSSSEQLNYSLDIDNKVDASFLVAKANYGFKVNSSLMFNQTSITLVIRAKTEFGRIGLTPGATLTDEAKNLLSNPAKFCQVCGTKFVSMERRGARVSAIISLRNLRTEEVTDINMEAGGGGGFGPISASAKLKLKSYMKRASEQGNVSVNIYSTGGTGMSSLADVVSALTVDPNSFGKIETALSTFLATFSKDNSVPIGFHLTPFTSLGLDVSNISLWEDIQERKLREIVEKYRSYAILLEYIDLIVLKKDVIHKAFNDDDIQKAKQQQIIIQNLMEQLAKCHKDLKDQNIEVSTVIIDETKIDAQLVAKVLKLMGKPSISRLLLVDKVFATILDTRVILLSPPNSRMNTVRQYFPAAKEAKVKYVIEGSMLHSFVVKFERDDNEITVLKSQKITNDKFIYDYVDLDEDLNSYKKWLEVGQHTGYFYIEIIDQFGRKNKYPVRFLSWSNDRINGHHTTVTSFDLDM